MKIQESGEMYLETIYILQSSQPVVRSIDVANEMNFSKPSVSRAMGILKANGFIDVLTNGQIILTKTGMELAQKTYERHNVLTKALSAIGVSKETAEEDACRIEHVISDETFEKIKATLK